jgi:hypothetical protein
MELLLLLPPLLFALAVDEDAVAAAAATEGGVAGALIAVGSCCLSAMNVEQSRLDLEFASTERATKQVCQ